MSRVSPMSGELAGEGLPVEGVECALERRGDAGEAGRGAQRVAGGLRPAEAVDAVEEGTDVVGVEGDDELLVVQAEAVRRVVVDVGVLLADPDVVLHHPVALGGGQRVPRPSLDERIDEEVLAVEPARGLAPLLGVLAGLAHAQERVRLRRPLGDARLPEDHVELVDAVEVLRLGDEHDVGVAARPDEAERLQQMVGGEVPAGGQELALVGGPLAVGQPPPGRVNLQKGVLHEVSFRHALPTIAVAAALAAAFPGTSQAAPRTVVVAFVPRVTLEQLARAVPGASIGLLGATQSRYRRAQTLLDMTQGTRTPLAAYDPDEPPQLRVERGRVAGWEAVVRRAAAAPAPIHPGLLGASVPGGAAYAGSLRGEAIVAADGSGRFAAVPTVAAGLRSHRVVVTVVRDLRELRRLVAARRRSTLLLAIGDPPPHARRAQLLPIAALGLGADRSLTSRTTRTDGLVTGIDVLPTALGWLGRPVPGSAQGEPLELDGRIDVSGLERFEARLRVVSARRLPTLAFLAAEWLVVLAVLRSRRA